MRQSNACSETGLSAGDEEWFPDRDKDRGSLRDWLRKLFGRDKKDQPARPKGPNEPPP